MGTPCVCSTESLKCLVEGGGYNGRCGSDADKPIGDSHGSVLQPSPL